MMPVQSWRGSPGANPDDHIVIFGKSTSEAINKLSYRPPLGPDDIFLVSQMGHYSNDLPWRARAQVVHINIDSLGRLGTAHFQELLAKHPGLGVIPPFLTGRSRRTYAAFFNFGAGVMPPMPRCPSTVCLQTVSGMFGRSLL